MAKNNKNDAANSGPNNDGKRVISIIIPAKNEQASIARTIATCVGAATFPSRLEIIVALAECTDNTEAEVNKCIALYPSLASLRTVKCGSGRSQPLNAGSRAATGDILMYVHADLILPLQFDVMVDACMSEPKNLLGAFRFGWDLSPLCREHPQVSPPSGLRALPTRIVQWFMSDLPPNVLSLPLPAGFLVSAYMFDLRGRLFLRPEGDQAIFLRQEDYTQLGEFLSDHCCMEDYEFVGRARSEAFRTGRTIQILPARVAASPRRELALGALFTSSINLVLYFLYDVCSFHPSKLFQVYYHPYVVALADAAKRA
jgi:hypothetical protein